MKRALLMLCLNLCLAVSMAAEELPAKGGEDVFLEMATPRSAYYVHEPIRLRVHIGFDPQFFRTNVIQPFARHLDVPVHLLVSWLEDLPGTVSFEGELHGPVDAGDRVAASGVRVEHLSFALNDGVAKALRIEDRLVAGRRFTVLEIERSFLPIRPGELVIPGPMLRFAYATRFQDDLVNGRVPVDRHDAEVFCEKRTLKIQSLPVEGRPPEYTGAVGPLSMQAEADPCKLELGESLRLMLHIEGDGNLGFFDPPRLDDLENFHVFGRIEDRDRMRLTVTYDLAPLSEEVREVPAIPFSYFDTKQPARYRIVRTLPIPIEVGPLPEGASLGWLSGYEAGRAVPGVTDIFGHKPVNVLARAETARALSPALLSSVLLAPWLLAIGLFFWLRARERLLSDPDGMRARRAAVVFRARANKPGADPAEAFAEYLAARLRCSAAAVIAPNLHDRLCAAGVPAVTADHAAALLENLVAMRYGASALPDAMESSRTLVTKLEVLFQAMEAAR